MQTPTSEPDGTPYKVPTIIPPPVVTHITGASVSFDSLSKPAPKATVQASPPEARRYVAGRKANG